MKKTLALIFAAAGCAAAVYGGTAAVAQTEYAEAETRASTQYPDFISELDIGGTQSYAVSDDAFAFSNGRRLYIYEGGTLTAESDESGNSTYVYEGGVMDAPEGRLFAYEHSAAIVNMSFSDDGLLFSDDSSVYLYSEGEVSAASAVIPPVSYPVTNAGLSYFIVDDGVLSVANGTEYRRFEENSYSEIKLIDGSVYAIRDGGLCIIEGGTLATVTVTPIVFRYRDVTQEQTISVGDTATLLKEVSSPRYALVPAGQYITEVDLSSLDGEYFIVGSDGTVSVESGTYALVLCTTGDADLIAIGNKTYITSSLGGKAEFSISEAPFDGAQLNYSAGIYSTPYMCEATELIALEPGATVRVIGQITAEGQTAGSALVTNFCRVIYTTDDGTDIEGYIATAFLTMYDFSGEDGEFTDPTLPDDYSEDDVILTVVLVIVIVVLVIAGVAYLAYVSGANRRKKKSGKSGGREYDNDESEEQ